MKKIFSLLLAIIMVLSFASCGGSDNDTETRDNISISQTEKADTDSASTENTEYTSKSSETGTLEHVHVYTSKITGASKCEEEGIMTFFCYCGDVFTEKFPATGHEWGKWKQTIEPTFTSKGEETRSCKVCDFAEKRDVAQLTLDDVFKSYPTLITTDEIDSLGFFNSTVELSEYKVFAWAIGHIDPTSTSQNNLTYTYSVSALNSFTDKYLGRTFDYSLAQKDNGSEKVVYDATAQTVTITYAGGMGGMDFYSNYIGYEQIDATHFTITYETNYDYRPKTAIILIEKSGDNYIITAHKEA